MGLKGNNSKDKLKQESSGRLLSMSLEKEQTGAVRHKIELRNITFVSDMEGHRRAKCVVQPCNTSVNSHHKGTKRKWNTAHEPSTSKVQNFQRQTLKSLKETDEAKKYLKSRTKRLSSAAGVMGLFAVVLALVDIEFTIRGNVNTSENLSPKDLRLIFSNRYRVAAVVVKSLLSASSILTSITVYYISHTELKYLVVRNIFHESESFYMTSLFPSCVLEVIICFLHVPPLLDYYGLPYELQLLVFLRLYLIAKYVKEHNMFVDNQSTALFASVTQTEISSTFLVKAYFLKFPFRIILTFYLLNIFLGGYFVHVIERTRNSYLDTVWMLVVTMTTLGFGDVVPKAVLARAFVGFASVLGIFLMALFISVVHEALQLKQQEKRILASMENAEHISKKKNLAASCIQSSWRLYRFVKENADTILWADWFKTQKLRVFQHKQAEIIRHWRTARRSWSRDDYWKKFFLADDMAMVLTDVSRSVGNVENFLQKQHGGRRISRGSRSASVVTPPPVIEEDEEIRAIEPPQHEENRKVPGMFVDSWMQSTTTGPVLPTAINLHPIQSGSAIQSNNPVEKYPNGHRNYASIGKSTEFDDGMRSRVTQRSRNESDPIDQGVISSETLHGKVESLENALDQIYFKMKTELRDVRDSLKMLNRYPESPNMASPFPPSRTDSRSFIFPRTVVDRVDV
ncbi:small conductance calcium-activated potassium channel protein 3-like [Montipora capricornis]|uniref:small conductance calcium-activated potassium channel protein 3-like n=1 Tax=Montipora capricornis TaxID=246305 RepID=UPI0035F1CC85